MSDVSPEILAQFQQRLQGVAGQPSSVALKIGKGPELPVPEALVKLLLQALQQAAAGKKIVLVESDTEISPEKAASLLHVSRPFLVTACTKTSFHRKGTKKQRDKVPT